MYTKQNLKSNLAAIGINPKGTLKVHSSYKAIGEVEGRAGTVLAALMEYMQDGLLVLPSHTWSNVNTRNPVMDALHTPTCVGIITELFRKMEGVHRSLHPTHSVCAYGQDAKSFIYGEENATSPCPEGGVYHKLWQRNAQILLIGVNFTTNTFIHGMEEWDGAVDTIKKEPESYYVITPEGQRLHSPQHRHCARIGSATFSKLEPEAMQAGILTLGKFGNATTRLMQARPLRTLVANHLTRDPNYLNQY
ncbi:MAG: AAC(3) family N-acetyltransferase [Defluviitaleaceae bacterium]|nr:AAC(3) family N-acetyltransferase [Defluviitaleaceae bacterium]